VIAKASRAAGLLAGVAVLVLAVLISFDVFMRYFLAATKCLPRRRRGE
jgi:TRAP-type C4-dicarboxylate transport system permease small subunit